MADASSMRSDGDAELSEVEARLDAAWHRLNVAWGLLEDSMALTFNAAFERSGVALRLDEGEQAQLLTHESVHPD